MKRNPAWVAAIVVVAAVGLLVGSTTAFGGDNPTPKAATADEYYSKGMTLEEISAASKGTPGEVIPPCPDAETITALKEKGLPQGPCDPLPEGEPMILPPKDDPEPTTNDQDVCPGAFSRNVDAPELPTRIETPCGPGAQLVDHELFVNAEGTGCAKITYRVAAKDPIETATACVGDPRDPTKPYVTNKVA